MDTVVIRLTSTGERVALPKQALLQKFPRSLLSQALADDSTAEVIEISNPLVTPEVLAVLQTVLTTGRWPTPAPEFGAVADYLNIPELQLLEPYLNIFSQYRPEVDFSDLQPIVSNPSLLHQLLKETIDGASPRIASYLLAHLNPSPDAKTDPYGLNSLFVYAAYAGQPEILAALRPFVNPVTAKLDEADVPSGEIRDEWDVNIYRTDKNQALLYGLYHGHPGVVAQLLPGADLSDFAWNPLWLAYLSGNFELFQQAAMSPVMTSKQVNTLVDTPGLSLPQLRLLLQRPDIDFSQGGVLTQLIPGATQEIDKPDTLLILDAFYRHPRMNPVEFFNALVYDDDRGASQIPIDLMMAWLADARLDPTGASDKFYEQLVWFWPLEVLTFFVQQFPSPAVKARLNAAYLNSPESLARNNPRQVAEILHAL